MHIVLCNSLTFIENFNLDQYYILHDAMIFNTQMVFVT